MARKFEVSIQQTHGDIPAPEGLWKGDGVGPVTASTIPLILSTPHRETHQHTVGEPLAQTPIVGGTSRCRRVMRCTRTNEGKLAGSNRNVRHNDPHFSIDVGVPEPQQ